MKKHILKDPDQLPDIKGNTNTVDLTGDQADAFFDALSSETSREVFEALYQEPSTPSELAEAINTSVQNIHYHLQKLEGADLIEPVETVYSNRGREVDIYAPTHEAVILITGMESTVNRIKRLLNRFVGSIAVLLIAALVIQLAATGGIVPTAPLLNDSENLKTDTPDEGMTTNPPDANQSKNVSFENSTLSTNKTESPDKTPKPNEDRSPLPDLPRSMYFLLGGLLSSILMLSHDYIQTK